MTPNGLNDAQLVITDFLDKIASLRILVVGDLILDHYIWGDVSRISPEAPVPVVHAKRESWSAGGAANVALNLAGLGVSCRLLGCLGHDESGRRLRDLIEARGVELQMQSTVSRRNPSTIIKTRVIARMQQLCRIDCEDPSENYRIAYNSSDAHNLVCRHIEDCHAIIVSDYAKGVVDQLLFNAILKVAKTRNLFVAVDPKPSRQLDLTGVGLLTPNHREALQLASIPEPRPDVQYPLGRVCREIQERYSPRYLVITLGADGMAIASNGKIETVLPMATHEIYDVSGAGDTVIATLTAAIVAGAPPLQAAQLANAAAGIVVGRMGTVPIDRSSISTAFT